MDRVQLDGATWTAFDASAETIALPPIGATASGAPPVNFALAVTYAKDREWAALEFIA